MIKNFVTKTLFFNEKTGFLRIFALSIVHFLILFVKILMKFVVKKFQLWLANDWTGVFCFLIAVLIFFKLFLRFAFFY